MNILVSIRRVPETTEVGVDPEIGTVSREGVFNNVNPVAPCTMEGACAVLSLQEQASRKDWSPSGGFTVIPSGDLV